MAHNIVYLPEESLVEVTFIGHVTAEDRIAVLDAISPNVRAMGIRNLLVDFSAAWHETLDTFDMAMLSSRLEREPDYKRGCRIAFVSLPETHSIASERRAAELGFQTRRFYAKDKARAWLSEQ